METGSQSWPRRLRSRGSVACLMALLITAGCASAPDSPRQTLSGPHTQATGSVDGFGTKRGAYTPSLTQVAYVPNTSDIPLVQVAVGATGEDDDPLEGLNRYFYDLNNALDILIFRQFAEAYRVVVPDGVRRSVTNFLRFIRTPVILANDLLQGDLKRAEITTSRFIVNAAIGFGFFDVASDSGLPYHEEDFGQTLAVWGVDSGPFLVLPLLGPTTVRDGAGSGVDILLDPLTYVLTTPQSIGRFGVTALDARERNLDTLDEIRRDALDEYARVRSLWLQNRREQILNNEEDIETAATEGFLRSDMDSPN